MIDFTPNSSGTIFVTLTSDNAPLINATVTCTVVNPAGTTIISAQNASADGAGRYSYALTAAHLASIGTYFVTWHVSAPIVQEQKTTFTVGYETASTLTRLDIRHAVARIAEGKENFVLGVVGSATSGTIVDTTRIEPDNHFRGFHFFVYSGGGEEQERRCTGSVSSTGTLSVTPNWSVTPSTGDRYEGHRFFALDDLNSAIALAHLEAAAFTHVPISDTSLVLVAGQYEYNVPAGFSHIFAVQICADNGNQYVDVAPGGWSVLRAIRVLKLYPSVPNAWGGTKIRLLGLRPPTDLLDDTSGVDVSPIFLIKKAASYLCLSKSLSPDNEPGGWSRKHQMFEVEAELARQQAQAHLPNNSRKVEL